MLQRRHPLTPVVGWRWLWGRLPIPEKKAGLPAAQPKGGSTLTAARVRHMKRCAPRILPWSVGLYAIAQIGLFLWLFMDARWQPERIKTEWQKRQAIRACAAEAPDRPLVVMLGSSRTDWGFQAGRLDGQPGPDGRPIRAYNLGVPAAGPIHESLYLRNLLDDGIRPRLLLVELIVTHFNEPRRGLMSEEGMTEGAWLSASQLAYYAPYFSRPQRKIHDWLEGRLAPAYAFRYHVHRRLQLPAGPRLWDPASQPMDPWGWRLLIPDTITEDYRAIRWKVARDMYAASLWRFRFADGPTRAMHELLARCRQEQIPVALVLMPTSASFRSMYHPDAVVALQRFLNELRERYGPEVIDATEWLDDDGFDDGHHLRRAGAQKFSTRMVEEVQSILARQEEG
ncbi:MAG TPA: hypothetical protein VN688_29715 [Gemmataceae bacterium]|nr:hypothetical protein [Gemmataceae bacterium]